MQIFSTVAGGGLRFDDSLGTYPSQTLYPVHTSDGFDFYIHPTPSMVTQSSELLLPSWCVRALKTAEIESKKLPTVITIDDPMDLYV